MARSPSGPIYALAALVIVVLVVLHAPWSGYVIRTTPDKVDTMTLLQRCPGIGNASNPDTTRDELLRSFDANLSCAAALAPVPVMIKPTRWRSNAPLLYSFGRLRNVMAGALLVLVVAWASASLLRLIKPGRQRRSVRPGQ